eukprot:1146865-Pelagomonas_calceolata.AAC.7
MMKRKCVKRALLCCNCRGLCDLTVTTFEWKPNGNRCPYELRVCNKCDWHTVRNKGHIILDCPQASQDLTNLHTHSQHLFDSATPSSASRLRGSMNQADVLGLAKLCTLLLQLSCPCRKARIEELWMQCPGRQHFKRQT